MPNDLPIIELEDAVADTRPDGDGVQHVLPTLDDRAALIESVVYGSGVSDRTIDHELNNEPAFKAIIDDQRQTEALAKLDNIRGQHTVETNQARLPGDVDRRAFISTGALVPPYDPGTLVHLIEHSNSLRQNIDAYRTNIDSFGHHFKPTLNLESDDIKEQVAVAMFQDAVLAGDPEPAMPSDKDVEAKIAEIKHAIAVERIKLQFFFENCVMNESFVTHRMNTRQDTEGTGNGYWEVLRDGTGAIAQFILVPSWTVRINPQGQELVAVEQVVRATPITWTKRLYRRRFRTYLQLHEGHRVYFKEFGDPRFVSARTGTAYDTLDALREAEQHDQAANEIIHFKIHSSRSPYGVPRWIGALLAVLGSRQAEEVNFLYFDNKGVPPMAMLVSGGRVSADTIQRVQDFIDNRIKGRGNFHKILVLEAEPASSAGGPEHTGRMRIELKPLTSAQHNDALFQKYDEANISKVGQAFRMPPLLRGDSRDFNRATAQAVLKFTEQQVFAPERNTFDDQINRTVLADMQICYHRFVSNSPKTTDPEDQAKVIERLARVGALVPRDIRSLAEEILNTELKRIDEPWVDIPLLIASSGRIAELIGGPGDLFDPASGTSQQTPLGGGKPGPQGGTDEQDVEAALRKAGKSPALIAAAKRVVRIRDTLRKAELAAVDFEREQAEWNKAKDAIEPNGETEVVHVPADVWESFGLLPE